MRMSTSRTRAISSACRTKRRSSPRSQEGPRPGNLISRTPWARLEIVFGRLRLTHCRLGQESTVSANVPEKGISENLAFSSKTAGSARLRYQYADGEQSLRVDFEDAASVVLEREPNGTAGSGSLESVAGRRADGGLGPAVARSLLLAPPGRGPSTPRDGAKRGLVPEPLGRTHAGRRTAYPHSADQTIAARP